MNAIEILRIVEGAEKAIQADEKAVTQWSKGIERQYNAPTTGMIDLAWDDAEHLGRKDLARRCETIFNWLTGE
tara:strand:+ start:489 stop:707 length:219 start_codon:yes stop_codon:yes gene_type:complete